MNKPLIKKAISTIEANLQKDGFISNIDSYEELFYITRILIKNDMQEKIQTTLKYIIKHQNRKGEFEFEKVINNKIISETDINPIHFLRLTNTLFRENNDKKIISEYIKPIRRAIEHIEKHFDETYLLNYRKDKNNIKTFHAKDNATFLSFANELSDTLNMHDYNKEADKLFMLKGKIELGFLRYIYNKDNRILISNFSPQTQNLTLSEPKEILEISNIYSFDNTLLETTIKKLLEKKEIEDMQELILLLINMKNTKNKKYPTKYKESISILEHFPKHISKTRAEENIKESIFQEYKKNIVELKKDKLFLINTNSPYIAALTLELEEK